MTLFFFPGGYIWFKTSIPEPLLFGGKHTVQSHFDLVNYQVLFDTLILSLLVGFRKVID